MEKKLTKGMLMTALICGTISIVPFGAVAHAEEAAADDAALQGFNLEQIVVTANRMEKKLVDTGANVSVVTAEEFEKKNYQTVTEALENVPGVLVQRNGGEWTNSYIYLNGDDRVLVLVDGRRLNQEKGMNSGRGGLDFMHLPAPEIIERIEIVKGGGSALYGSDAVGGVINIITKRADKTTGKININTGSWGTQNYRGMVSFKQGKTGITITGSKQKQNYTKYRDSESGSTERWPNSASKTVTASIKIEQEIGNDQLATVYFDHSNRDANQPYQIAKSPNFDSGGWSKEINNNFVAKYQWGVNSSNPGYIQYYRNHYSGNFLSTGPWGSLSRYYETKDGVDIQQKFRLSEKNDLIGGFDWKRSKVFNESSYDGEKKLTTYAFYLEDNWRFADTWSLTGGIRYDHHNYFGHKTTGSVSINKKFNEDSHAFVSWGQVFNAPQGNDLFYNSYGMYGNPNLKPESGYVWTVGYDGKITDRTTFGINAFYSVLKDAIDWGPVDPTYMTSFDWTVKNVAKQKKRGMEINIRHKFNDALAVRASYTHTRVMENNNDGLGFVRDSNVMPNRYLLGIDYSKGKFDSSLDCRIGSGGDLERYYGSHYFTMDLSMQYSPEKNYKIYFKGYNLTNASYAERAGLVGRSYAYPMGGRAFLVGAEYSF